MTWRFVILTGLGVVPVAIAVSSGSGWLSLIIYNALIFFLYLADVLLTPGKKNINVSRLFDNKLYFRAENSIEFSVKNTCNKPLIIELKDDLPSWHFHIEREDMKKKVFPGNEVIFSYVVVPKKRGAYAFNKVYIRYDGILGLCRKYCTTELPIEYKVYPNLTDLSKYRLIIQKHRLLTNGTRRIPVKGTGSEFESLRDYVDGDDYRKVNWMATARLNKLIVNQYEAEKNQPVYVLLDTGRSMSYSIGGYKKLDYAINAALILSDIVNQKGDISGLMVFNTEVTALVPPGKGESHRNELMETLYHVEDTNMPSDYSGAFHRLISIQKRRSIVFLFTDFETAQEADELTESIAILKRRHIPVVVVTINESLEKIAQGSAKDIKGVYNEAMAESLISERSSFVRRLNLQGIICVETYAREFAINTVNQYLTLKERFMS